MWPIQWEINEKKFYPTFRKIFKEVEILSFYDLTKC